MLPDTPTPCFGKHELFDSTHIADHREARGLCATCPVMLQCATHLQTVLRDTKSGGRPEGTWAGQLLTDLTPLGREHTERRLQARVEEDETRYTDEQARMARAAYLGGERSPWVTTGYRVYNRRTKRNQRLRREAVA